MQPTVSPWAWVSSWDRRARARAAGEFARSRDHVAPRARERDKYAFYGLRKDSRHFIRNIPTIIDDDVPSRLDPLAKGLLLNRQWAPTSAPVTWRVDRFHDTERPWAVPDIKSIQSYRPYETVAVVLPSEVATGPVMPPGAAGAPRTMGPIAHSWSHGAGGWAAGAVVLALLVLLVRAAENCLHKNLFRAIYAHTNVGAGELQQNETRPGQYRLPGVRRQESDEWSTPNVMATSQNRDDTVSLTDMDDIEDPPDVGHHNNDMPPPYSECTLPSITNINNINKYGSEEPPPPYSACYVSYTNPKDAEPQVHIRRQNYLDERAHSSTDIDNVQNDLIENGHRADSFDMTTALNESEDDASGIRTELVFDNGRIVERLSLDLNSNNNETRVASNDNAVEQSTRHADSKDRVMYIDETASESTSPDTALLV